MYLFSPWRWVALATGTLVAQISVATMAGDIPCAPQAPCAAESSLVQHEPSWIFRRSTYTNDPYTGARVAQYMRIPPVEPLEDERNITSRYRRSRTNLRGVDGSVDTYYEVQAWGNGRGGIDAEWERFHDAWKESILSGGYYNQSPGYFGPGYYDRAYGVPWDHGGRVGGPGYGYGYPGYGYPGYGQGGPSQGSGPWQGGSYPGRGGHHGGGRHDNGGHDNGRNDNRRHGGSHPPGDDD